MLEMLCIEHQLILYKEMKERFKDLDLKQLAERERIKNSRKRVTDQVTKKHSEKKKKIYLNSYEKQLKKINSLKAKNVPIENSFIPQ